MFGGTGLLMHKGKTQSDPYFGNVIIQLPFTGEEGSADIIDVSSHGHIVTPFSGTTITRAVLDPFGNNTGVLNCPTGVKIVSDEVNFGNSHFTIEGFFRLKNTSSSYMRLLSLGYQNLGLYLSGNTLFGMVEGNWTNALATLPIDEWLFLFLVRNSAYLGLYLGHTNILAYSTNDQITAGYNSTPNYYGLPPTIGFGCEIAGGYGSPVYMSNWRVTKGVARDVIVPTAPFYII